MSYDHFPWETSTFILTTRRGDSLLSAMLRTHDRRHSPLVPYRPDLPCWNWTAEWRIENTGVKRKQDGGDLFVQLYTKWRQIYRVSCISCCEILKTFLKLNPQYLTYFNVDLKKCMLFCYVLFTLRAMELDHSGPKTFYLLFSCNAKCPNSSVNVNSSP